MAEQTRRAVLIGVDEYEDSEIPNLEGPQNDAKELCQLLQRSGSFKIDACLLGKEATATAIWTAVSDLIWRTDPVDFALLYFSGHAYDDEYGNGFLAPYDMEYKRPFVHGIRMQELNELIRSAVSKDVILTVLDACKSGIAAEGGRGGPAERVEFRQAFEKLDAEDEGKGRIILASSGADEKSHERSDCLHQFLGGDAHAHGAFTFHMLEGLSGRAATKGTTVTLHDLHAYVENELTGRQKVTFFGGGMQHSEGITIVEATDFASIQDKLSKAHELVASGEIAKLFQAIKTVDQVRSQTGSNERVLELTGEIDRVLKRHEDSAWMIIVNNRVDFTDCPDACKRVEDLLVDVCFEDLATTEPGLFGLMIGLFEAGQSMDDPDVGSLEYKKWLRQMTVVEKLRERPQIVDAPKGLGARP